MMKTSVWVLAAWSVWMVAHTLGDNLSWAAESQGDWNPTVISRQQVEADWLRQDEVRSFSQTPPGGITTQEDAAGGCDGNKDGRWGFHTGRQANPWWQVDLGREWPLDQVFIYNRCDACSDRALRLVLLLSSDGQRWSQAYQHDGTPFLGLPDNRPLIVPLKGAKARFVRVQLPGSEPLHLDEIEIFPISNHRNLALGRPADQSSVSPWSRGSDVVVPQATRYPTAAVIERGLKLADNLRANGARVDMHVRDLEETAAVWKSPTAGASPETQQELYYQARWAVRKLALANPLLDFDRVLFVKRVPTSFTHMSDQYYGWFSRPGGGLYLLEDFKSDAPRLRCLTEDLPPGNILRPDLSYDGTRVLFAFAKYYPGLAELENKLDKSKIPEDAFYHLYEMELDGCGTGSATCATGSASATRGLRRLTSGKYDHFDGRYLPSGEIVFLSTRKGQFLQCGKASAAASCAGELPDSYVRCGGGPERPVAIYTLHVMDAEGGNLRAISAFESFEWTPSVTEDGRVLYARWDYVDREAMPFLSLWSTMPDGTNHQAVYGNYTVNPHAIFEARSIPGSHKLIFTASAHHSITGGSLVLLDPSVGADGFEPLTRLTPEVPFPEIESWPETYYANPYPLSEQHHLVAWSDQPLAPGWPRVNPPNALGLYLFDSFGNLELVYRDPEISSMYPLPVRPRRRPPAVATNVRWEGSEEGCMLLLNAGQGLYGAAPGGVHRLRIIGVTPKTQPTMNSPNLGVTGHDPGKFVLGTVPVEKDGSAYFRVPSGMPFFLQALDAEGMAVQTMRTATYVQPGQTYTCVGCHEPRNRTPANTVPLAALREPSKITPGPEGSWPLDFGVLVQPLLDKHCAGCHQAGAEGAGTDLTASKSYESLTSYGQRSLRVHVRQRHRQGRSTAGGCEARSSELLELLSKGHYDVKLDRSDMDRLITWMDAYAQRTGSFSEDQQQRLRELRKRMEHLLVSSN